MVKTILSFFLFFQTLALFAQNFKVESTFVSQQGNATEEISPPTTIRNLSRQAIVLQWEVSKKNLPEGWTMKVNDRYMTDKGTLTLANSETFPDFKVNFQPNGFVGIGNVEIVVFEPSNRTATETSVIFTASASSANAVPTNDLPQVFPNPATDYITINSTTNNVRRVEVFNIVGRKVLEFNNSSSDDKHDVSSLPRGMYLVRLLDAQGHIIRTQRVSKYNP